MAKYRPDTLDDVRGSDLVQLSRNLLESIVESTAMLELKRGQMTPAKLQEAKITLGYLNASINSVKTRMQFFKMVGVKGKIQAIRAHAKNM